MYLRSVPSQNTPRRTGGAGGERHLSGTQSQPSRSNQRPCRSGDPAQDLGPQSPTPRPPGPPRGPLPSAAVTDPVGEPSWAFRCSAPPQATSDPARGAPQAQGGRAAGVRPPDPGTPPSFQGLDPDPGQDSLEGRCLGSEPGRTRLRMGLPVVPHWAGEGVPRVHGPAGGRWGGTGVLCVSRCP